MRGCIGKHGLLRRGFTRVCVPCVSTTFELARSEVVTLVTAGTHEVGFARRRLAHVRAGLPVEWVVEDEGEAARGECAAR